MISIDKLLSQYQPLNPEASRQFDQIRGFSAASVVFCHAYLLFLYPIWPAAMLPIYLTAHACVMALFALSGFLICQSACHNIQKYKQFNVKQYTRARINRIVPPLYFACIVLVMLYWLSPSVFATGNREFKIISETISQANMSLHLKDLLGVLFFMNGFITETPASNFAFWSLSFEAWFYILFGILLLPNRSMSILFSLVGLVILSTLNYIFLLYVCIWLAGAIAALLYQQRYHLNKKQIIFIIMMITIMLGFLYTIQASPLAIYGTWIGIILAILLYLIATQKVKIWLPCYFIAKTSYTIYLLHFPILLFIYGVIQPYIYHNVMLLIFSTLSAATLSIIIGIICGKRIENIQIL